MLYREELISYYKQLSDDVILRTTRAEWKVRRHRLDEQRVAWLRSSASLTSSADDVATEVLPIYCASATTQPDHPTVCRHSAMVTAIAGKEIAHSA